MSYYPRLALVRRALANAEQVCRYHGTDFGRCGWWMGEPRCDSCKQPYRITEALRELEDLRRREDEEVAS